jgi:periplasmic protein TonB
VPTESTPRPPSSSATPVRIETLDLALGRRRHPITLPLSLGLHAVVLLAIVVVPLLVPDELPMASTAVRAFFAEPAVVAAPPPPPPPPPPAAPRGAPARAKAPAPTDTALRAPVVEPDELPAEDGPDLGLEGGVPGGVEGGVEGGVVGGVIGGLPEPAPPVAPVRVGGDIREPKKLKHVAPQYPELARHARVSGVVVLEALVGADGRVAEVTVLRGVPMLDVAAVEAVRQWLYTPTLCNGVPVPVLMTVTLRFNLTTT